jgi:hypothetical protein
MTKPADISGLLVLAYGIGLLDQAYWDLSADQRKLPHIQKATAALDALSDAIETALARATHSQTSPVSIFTPGRLQRLLMQLAAAWAATPDDQQHDAVTHRWKRRCARSRPPAVLRKKKQAAK